MVVLAAPLVMIIAVSIHFVNTDNQVFHWLSIMLCCTGTTNYFLLKSTENIADIHTTALEMIRITLNLTFLIHFSQSFLGVLVVQSRQENNSMTIKHIIIIKTKISNRNMTLNHCVKNCSN